MISDLEAVAEDLLAGNPVKDVSVRDFLSWFDAQRRGVNVVRYIREKLKEVDVETFPDFESAWIEAPINFRLNKKGRPSDNNPQRKDDAMLPTATLDADNNSVASAWINRDPTYRVSKLSAANVEVTCIAPDEAVNKAVTLMLANNFSQLPVVSGERSIKGLISWKTIGSKMALGLELKRVRDAMEQTREVPANSSIFDVIPIIVEYGYVLVRTEDNRISGIVTASDLSEQFKSLTEPFLILSEIENLIRNMIGAVFSKEDLVEALDPGVRERSVTNVADLTFGEYVHLLEDPARWDRLSLSIDRTLFCKHLDVIRSIRNDVMHFDPDGITPEQLSDLRRFVQFLKQLDELRV